MAADNVPCQPGYARVEWVESLGGFDEIDSIDMVTWCNVPMVFIVINSG